MTAAAVTLTPCADDGRRTVSIAWGEGKTIGRNDRTRNKDGMPKDPRVHQQHIQIDADKSSCVVRLIVKGKNGASLRRHGHADRKLQEGAETELTSGDEIMLVDEITNPGRSSDQDSTAYIGNRCAYRVEVFAPLQTKTSKRFPADEDDGRRVRARQDAERALEARAAGIRADADARVELAQQQQRLAEERASAAEAASASEATAHQEAAQRIAGAEQRASAAEAASASEAAARQEAEQRATATEQSAAAAEARAQAAETAREAAEAGLAYLEDELNEQEEEEEEAAVATPPTMLTQAFDEIEYSQVVVDPRMQRQKHREEQMIRFAKNLEKRLHELYDVPASRNASLCDKLRHARDCCGMPRDLYDAADRVRHWRNISAHHGDRELPESDEQMERVIRPVARLLKIEAKRLQGQPQRGTQRQTPSGAFECHLRRGAW